MSVERSALCDRVAAAIPPVSPGMRLGVAFSGGVDSSVLLAVAARAIGPKNVVALYGASVLQTRAERERVRELAALISCSLVELEYQALADRSFSVNLPNRCHICKNRLFTHVIDDAVKAEHRIEAVVFGENRDDLERTDRPGAVAAAELGVLAPLAIAGLGKAEVRALAHELGLPNADLPSLPCLATRIPFGVPLESAILLRVDEAEEAIRSIVPVSKLRVRVHGDIARIEVPRTELSLLAEPEICERVCGALYSLGFHYVTVDLEGLASGRFAAQMVHGTTTETNDE